MWNDWAEYVSRRSRNVVPALVLFATGLATLALAGYPLYIIRPFREQTPADLSRALWVLLHLKPITSLLALGIIVAALLLWQRTRLVARLFLIPSVVMVLIAAASAWINPYEKMFHPFGEPSYIAAQKVSVDSGDMVIAVTLEGESRAYPIREMGYHHVVNDRLHQLPIVVTY